MLSTTVLVLFAAVFGVLVGVITGIIPGLHVNFIATIFLTTDWNFIFFAPFIMSLAVTHTFLDAIPSTFLGCPNADTAIEALPAHKFVQNGYGIDAILLLTGGAFFSLLLTAIFAPIIYYLSPILYRGIKPALPVILPLLLIFLIMREQTLKQKILATIIVLLAGFLGAIVLNNNLLKDPFFPLLSGLFGISSLLLSLQEQNYLPPQHPLTVGAPVKTVINSCIRALIAGFIAALLPGVGASQSTNVTAPKENSERAYLLTVGGVSTVTTILALVTSITLLKSRSGIVSALITIAPLTNELLIELLLVSIIAGSIASILTLALSIPVANLLTRINIKWFNCTIIIATIILSLFIDGYRGLLVLITATAIGILAPIWKVSRSHNMACILIPVILLLSNY